MPNESRPPPSQTLLAAAAGGFGGALLGVVAAGMLAGDGGDGANGQTAIDAAETKTKAVEVVVAER